MRTRKTTTRYGEMMVAASDTYVGRSLVEYGEWTQSEIDLLAQLARPGMTVLDVGANVGYHTLALSKAVGDQGAVVSFEPQPAIFQLLAANIVNNGLSNVTALNMAVGEKRSLLDMPPFSYDDAQNYGALDIRPHIKDESAAASYIPIPVQRLDDIVLARNAGLIKMDVEGMELAALLGASEILTRRRPALFLENNDKGKASADLLQFLESKGYDCYWQIAFSFEPGNFRRNGVNVFGNGACVNNLAIPREANSGVKGLMKVADANDHPNQWGMERLQTLYPGRFVLA